MKTLETCQTIAEVLGWALTTPSDSIEPHGSKESQMLHQAALIGARKAVEEAAQLQEQECNCGQDGCQPVARARDIRALDAAAIVKKGM